MKVFINKEEIEVKENSSLSDLMEIRGINGPGIAVAIDGKIARRGDWSSTSLSEGMEITVISAVCGG